MKVAFARDFPNQACSAVVRRDHKGITLSTQFPIEVSNLSGVLWPVGADDSLHPALQQIASYSEMEICRSIVPSQYTISWYRPLVLHIGDAVSLTSDRIKGNRLFLRSAKTGTPVNTVLPDFVLEALEASPEVTGAYYFWNSTDKLNAIVGSWRRRLANLFELAEVTKGHAHRFRDTFAVELLLAGIPIERVSVLLWHQSVRITEKHYSPWVHSRQEQLEQDLKRAWEVDPVALIETKGRPEVHGKKVKRITETTLRGCFGGAGGNRTHA